MTLMIYYFQIISNKIIRVNITEAIVLRKEQDNLIKMIKITALIEKFNDQQ